MNFICMLKLQEQQNINNFFISRNFINGSLVERAHEIIHLDRRKMEMINDCGDFDDFSKYLYNSETFLGHLLFQFCRRQNTD